MMVTIDREECTSCTLCWSDCPEVFEENPDDGWSQIVPRFRVDDNPAQGDVPDELVESAKEAADSCPAEIIHIG